MEERRGVQVGQGHQGAGVEGEVLVYHREGVGEEEGQAGAPRYLRAEI